MAEVTAGMVKALREKTDAPMMECKKALAEAGGHLGKAEEILRVKLGNRASKSASRATGEGAIAAYVAPDGKTGALVELNCETDFVAKNDAFLRFAGALAEVAAKLRPADVEALSRAPLEGTTVEEFRKVLAGKIGENMAIRRFVSLQSEGRLASYIHGGAKIGVLVDVSGGDAGLAKDLAMHIAASKPIALSAAAVPLALVQKERSIAAAKAAESGKPANIVEKMVEGGVQKFLKEVTLLGQPFVKNDKQTVDQLLKAKGAGVSAFVLYVVGEGAKDDVIGQAA